MKKIDLLLSVIAESEGRQVGRTALQKLAYFAGSGLSIDLGHRAYYYGPYSSEIERLVGDLVLAELVEEKSTSIGINREGFPVRQYEYHLTEEGKQRLKAVRNTHKDVSDGLSKVIRRIIEGLGVSPSTLSAAAKVHFIESEKETKLTDDQIAAIADNRGWKLSQPEIARVRSIISEYGPK